MTLSAGTKLGRYEIRSKIGAGGMGQVYLGPTPRESRGVVVSSEQGPDARDESIAHYDTGIWLYKTGDCETATHRHGVDANAKAHAVIRNTIW